MVKKWMLACLALVLTAGISGKAAAEEPYGELLVWMRNDQVMVTEGSLDLYQVGEPVPEGYRLGEEFGGGIVAAGDILSSAFAQWMGEKTGPGYEKAVDRNGLVRFEGLEPGLYLIRQKRESQYFEPIDPFLACISPELSRVDTYPGLVLRRPSPKTGQGPELYLGLAGICLSISMLAIVGWKVQKSH